MYVAWKGRKSLKYVRRVADRHYRGGLRVIGSRSLFPRSAGVEVSFALSDDPDAVVVLEDVDKGACQGEPCGPALTRAVASARAEAARWRSLSAAFERGGYPVIGLETFNGAFDPWVVAAPTNATVTALIGVLADCAREYAQAMADNGSPLTDEVTVNVITPAGAKGRPKRKRRVPTLAYMESDALLMALEERHDTTAYTVHFPIVDGRIDPDAGSLSIDLPSTLAQARDETLTATVESRLRVIHPEASDIMPMWRLMAEPGTVDRIRQYVTFQCDLEPSRTPQLSERAVAVTTDLEGNLLGQFTILNNRNARGELDLSRAWPTED